MANPCNKNLSIILLFSIFIIFVLFLSLNFRIYALTKNGQFYFENDVYEVPQNCEYPLKLIVDPGSNLSNAADVILKYNPNDIEIIDSIQNVPGKQIQPGNAYEYYPSTGNIVDETSGTIRLVGVSYDKILDKKGVFTIIKIKLKSNTANINIVFDGIDKTTDSNIAEYNSSIDILSQVKSVQLKKSNSASCPQEDVVPPNILVNSSYVQMKNGGKLVFIVSDNLSGINLNSLKVVVGDKVYDYGSNSFGIIPVSNGYQIELVLDDISFDSDFISFSIIVSDKAGNVNSVNTNLTEAKQNMTECNCPSIQNNADNDLDEDKSDLYIAQNQYRNLNEQIFGFLPQNLSFVSDAGFIAPFTLAITLPLLYFISALVSSFLSGGFLVPFLLSLFRRKGNIKVLDSISKEGIPFVKVKVYQRGYDKVIKQYVTSPFGSFDFDLYDGFYTLELEKRGYQNLRYELNHTDPKGLSLILLMESEEDVLKQNKFDFIYKILSYVVVFFAFMNFVMMQSVISLIVLIIIIGAVFAYNYLFHSAR